MAATREYTQSDLQAAVDECVQQLRLRIHGILFVMALLAATDANRNAHPKPAALPVAEPVTPSVEERWVVPGVGFSSDGDV